jgi:hypothetical protein
LGLAIRLKVIPDDAKLAEAARAAR